MCWEASQSGNAGVRSLWCSPAAVLLACAVFQALCNRPCVAQVEAEACLRRQGAALTVDLRQLGAVVRLHEV